MRLVGIKWAKLENAEVLFGYFEISKAYMKYFKMCMPSKMIIDVSAL